LIGLTIHVGFLMAHWQAVGIAIVAVLFARAFSVFALVPLLNRFTRKKPISLSWQTVLVWGGLRGALSMALALSLPKTMPERPLILAMVFGVVLFSLIVQGLSIPALLKKLGLYRPAKVF